MFHFILTCYIKNEWRIYATPIRHIQNLRTDPQKSSENEKWRIYATSIRHLIKPFSATNLLLQINAKMHTCLLPFNIYTYSAFWLIFFFLIYLLSEF